MKKLTPSLFILATSGIILTSLFTSDNAGEFIINTATLFTFLATLTSGAFLAYLLMSAVPWLKIVILVAVLASVFTVTVSGKHSLNFSRGMQMMAGNLKDMGSTLDSQLKFKEMATIVIDEKN